MLNVSTNNLFHRLIIVVEWSANDVNNIADYLAYELTPTPASLLKDDLMKKLDKLALARFFYADVTSDSMPRQVSYTIFQMVVWWLLAASCVLVQKFHCSGNSTAVCFQHWQVVWVRYCCGV